MDIENEIPQKINYLKYYLIESGYLTNHCFDKYIFGFCKKPFVNIKIGTAVYINHISLNTINIMCYYNEKLTEKELEKLSEQYKCDFSLFPSDGIYEIKKCSVNLLLIES